MRLHIQILLINAGLVLFSAAQAQTPYGSCPETAQHYQSEYERNLRTQDLVCFQHALERELGANMDTPPLASSPMSRLTSKEEHNQGLSRLETFCQDQLSGPGSLTQCILQQNAAQTRIDAKMAALGIDAYRTKMNACTHYTTGDRGLGSMENIDQVPVANCMEADAPQPIYDACVKSVTGKAPEAGIIHWKREDADKIATCFNTKVVSTS